MDNHSFEASQDLMAKTLQDLKDNFLLGETKSVAFRKAVLQNFRRIFKAAEKEINDACKSDLGLSPFFSYLTGTSQVLAEVDHALRYLNKWTQAQPCDTVMPLFPATEYIHNEPLGVVLIIGAWNYPFTTTLLPFVSAIAAGNCVIIKPSEHARESSHVMHKILSQLDQRFYRCIEGGVETAKYLNKQKFDLIIFTGGTTTGKFVLKDAAENLCPVLLELGGKNPVIIDTTVNMELAVKRVVSMKFMNCGQTCVTTDFIFVHKALKDAFTAAVIKQIKEYYGADAKACNDYSRIINPYHTKRLLKYLEGQQSKIVYQQGTPEVESCYIPPTVLLNPSLDSAIMKEEIFGPLLPIIEFSDFKEVIDYLQKQPKPLCTFYFGDIKSQNYADLKNKTSSGCLMTNDLAFNYASFSTGFGGVGDSGMGKIRGYEGFKWCSNQRIIIEKSRSGFLDLPFRYPPITPEKMRQTKFLLDLVGSRTFEELYSKVKTVFLVLLAVIVLYVLITKNILVINLR